MLLKKMCTREYRKPRKQKHTKRSNMTLGLVIETRKIVNISSHKAILKLY